MIIDDNDYGVNILCIIVLMFKLITHQAKWKNEIIETKNVRQQVEINISWWEYIKQWHYTSSVV